MNEKDVKLETISCLLCKKEFRRITNTHLWKYHRITIDEYLTKFPDAVIDAPGLAFSRVSNLRGRTYEQILGEEKGNQLRKSRSAPTTNQMKDPDQIKIRQEKCGYPISDSQKEKLSKQNTKHGGCTYRKRALEYYGLECTSCGKTTSNPRDFSVHHKNFLNFHYELGDHSIENLEVLCRSCHSRLHNALLRTKQGFSGISSIEKGFHFILKGLKDEFGLDLTDENFADTPKRIAKAYYEIFEGVRDTEAQVTKILNSKFPSGKYDQMIISKDIEVYSMCPHHFLPVVYKIDLGYIPSKDGFVLGISKLSRLVELLAKRPIIQEALTQEIGHYLDTIKPLGVMVCVRGEHYCMKMRGVKQFNSTMITSYTSGVFREDIKVREEFAASIGNK